MPRHHDAACHAGYLDLGACWLCFVAHFPIEVFPGLQVYADRGWFKRLVMGQSDIDKLKATDEGLTKCLGDMMASMQGTTLKVVGDVYERVKQSEQAMLANFEKLGNDVSAVGVSTWEYSVFAVTGVASVVEGLSVSVCASPMVLPMSACFWQHVGITPRLLGLHCVQQCTCLLELPAQHATVSWSV